MTEERVDTFASKPWQAKISRRRFLGAGFAIAGAAGLAGYLPEHLAGAAEASTASRRPPFDLSQIKHLVFVMQENRSFDHYFGTFPGVRGFSDPTAIELPDGRSVFQQPAPTNPDTYLEPFHISTVTTGAAAVSSLGHDWQAEHSCWDRGAMDGWVETHLADDGPGNGPYTMGYYTQEDLPFHWAVADAFTILDNYHCSVLGPSNPNRITWSCGTIDPQGLGGGPILDDSVPPYTFKTGAETLYDAGYTVKSYPGGLGPLWEFFAQFKTAGILPDALRLPVVTTDTLFGDGTPGGIGNPADPTPASVPGHGFEEDCANGVLPDVTFMSVVSSEWNAYCEHPPNIPAAGAQWLAEVLDALAANEDLWNTTAVVLNYDENDGFFDHVPPPTPNRADFPEEFVTKVSAAGVPGLGLPVGASFRVPCFVISPWSTGGNIFSEVNDHTSCLRLIEAVAAAGGLSGRGPVTFPLISRWRRQTFGDLTGTLSGAAQAPPTSPEFDPGVRASNLAAQQASAQLPQAPDPGANQTMPVQVKAKR